MVNKFMGYMPRRREFSEEEGFQIVEVDIPSQKKKKLVHVQWKSYKNEISSGCGSVSPCYGVFFIFGIRKS